MEVVDANPQFGTVYNLQAKPLQFEATTLCVKNVKSYITNEVFFSLMSENSRKVKKFELFPCKKDASTTIGLVTFMSKAEADDAIYWLNGTPPQKFKIQYAKDSIKDIKNFCNPCWTVACEEACIKQKRAWNLYKNKPTLTNLNNYKESKKFFRNVRRKAEREFTGKVLYKQVKVEDESIENGPSWEYNSEDSNQERIEEEPEPPAKRIKMKEESIESEKESEPESEVENQQNELISKEETDENTFSFSSSPTLEEIRQHVAKFAKERNWDTYHQPRNLSLALVGEVGELTELFAWKGEVKTGLPGWTDVEKKHLGEELSDVLIYLIRLSEKCHINLPAVVMQKIALNAEKYPASKVYGSSKKYTEYQNSP